MREAEFKFKIHKRLQQGRVLIYNPSDMKLPLTIKVFYEGTSKDAPWVSYNPELNVASCGPTEKKARENLREAIEIVLEGAKQDGNLRELLRESGFEIEEGKVRPPKILVEEFAFPAI